MSWAKSSRKLTVGNVEVLDLCDCVVDVSIPLSELFPKVSPQAWVPYRKRFPESFSGPQTWRVRIGGFLLRSEGLNILVDTGIGSGEINPVAVAFFNGGIDGMMLAELESVGILPEDVDAVIITHLHRDHVGWNFMPGICGPKPTFPNARYMIHQADWDFFSNPETRKWESAANWEMTVAPLETLGLLDIISKNQAITGEVTTVHTPGHTPGHMSVAIASGHEQALITGDVVVMPTQVTEVDWEFRGDHDHHLAAQTRKQVLDNLEAKDALVIGCHFPDPGVGKLVRVEGRRYWQGL